MKTVKITSRTKKDIVLPSEIMPLLAGLSAEKLKVLIFCLSEDEFELSEGAERTGLTENEFGEALDFWTACELISYSDKAAPKKHTNFMQTYDGETLANAIKEDTDFATLKDTVEDMIGKLLNKNDISLLYNMYHYMGLGADYICAVCAYAVGKDKGNMYYISKTVISLYDDGIDSYKKLEETLSERSKHDTMRSKLISLCGFGSRKLSAKEESYVTRWFDEFALDFDVVKQAYEKTVDTIGEAKLSYMDKIITDWYNQGVRTRDAAIEAQKASTGKSRAQLETSFDLGEFIKAATEAESKKDADIK